MNAIVSQFQFDGHKVRAFDLNGEPWFVGKDVAETLAYTNPQKALRDHCRARKPIGVNDLFTPPLDPQTVIIPERDVYRLILRSNLFIQWIEVEFDFGRMTATRMMNAAERFGSNVTRVLHLPQRTVYLLASPSTPDSIREDVLSRPIDDVPVFEEIRDLVKDAKAAERDSRVVAKLTPDERKSKERRDAHRAREEAKWREERRTEREAAQTAVDLLREYLGGDFIEVARALKDVNTMLFREALVAAMGTPG